MPGRPVRPRRAGYGRLGRECSSVPAVATGLGQVYAMVNHQPPTSFEPPANGFVAESSGQTLSPREEAVLLGGSVAQLVDGGRRRRRAEGASLGLLRHTGIVTGTATTWSELSTELSPP